MGRVGKVKKNVFVVKLSRLYCQGCGDLILVAARDLIRREEVHAHMFQGGQKLTDQDDQLCKKCGWWFGGAFLDETQWVQPHEIQ